MSEIEERLQRLPWAEPSTDLRQRIFSAPAPGRITRLFRQRRIAVGWAALWILSASLFGYIAGRTQRLPLTSRSSEVDFLMVETGTGQNFFDQTGGIVDGLPGEWVLHVEPEEEIPG